MATNIMWKLSIYISLCLVSLSNKNVWAAKQFEPSKDVHFMAMIKKLHKIVNCGFDPKQVMDVGASKGVWTQSILSIYPNTQVLMVEANDFFEPLLKEIEQPYEIAMISDKILPNAEFYIGAGDSAGSSMHRENSHHPFQKIIRPSHTIDELAQKHNWTPDILKIDIQGSEYQALRGASKVLKTATIVFIEAPVHNFNQGAASFRQLTALLARAGFELYDIFGLNEIKHFKIQFDAVYVRKTSPLWSQSCTGFPVPSTFRLPAAPAASTADAKSTEDNTSWLKARLPSRMYEEDFWTFDLIGCGYRPTVIMDVGAAAGKWAVNAQQYFPEAQLFVIEGNPAFESTLKTSNLRYQIALLSEKESSDVKFYVPSDENAPLEAGSFFKQNANAGFKEVAMSTTTLDAIARKLNLYPDLLKIDVQGGELLVLKGASEVLKSANMVILEIQIHNLYHGAPLFRQLAALLWKAGFELYDIFGFNFLGPYLVQFDAVFVRTTSFMWKQNCTGFPIPAHFRLDISEKMNQLKDKEKLSFSN